MKNGLMMASSSFQTTPEMSGEGLPFWLFWLLLCIILLLIFFIFLRDKSLRQRMSAFLSRARRRMLRRRLQAKIKKEEEKKVLLWKELGKEAWSKEILVEHAEAIFEKLKAFDEEIHTQQLRWHDVFSKIEVLSRQHEETTQGFRNMLREQEANRKEHLEEMGKAQAREKELMKSIEGFRDDDEAARSQLKEIANHPHILKGNDKTTEEERKAKNAKANEVTASLREWSEELREKRRLAEKEFVHVEKERARVQAMIDVSNQKIRKISNEYKEVRRAQEHEVREHQKTKEKIQQKIIGLKGHMEPLLENLGKMLDESRIDNDDLAIHYFKIDRVDKAIRDYLTRIEKLR